MAKLQRNLSFLYKEIELSDFIVAFMFLLTLATGFVNQTFLSLGIMICCAVLMLQNKLCFALPFVLFYNSFYGVVFGASVLRIFSLLIILNVAFRYGEKYKIKNKQISVLFVYAIYLVAVMMPQGIGTAIFVFIDIVACLALVAELLSSDVLLNETFKIYTGVCFSSFLTGIVCQNTIGGGYNYLRFNATFEDPNYMGFFFTIAVFSVIALKLFDKRVRYIIVVVLYIMMMTSLSMTAIVVNILMWAIYCVVTKKIKPKYILSAMFVVAILVGIYFYGLNHPDIPVLGGLASRVEEKIVNLTSGDVGDFTTGRTDYVKEHFTYYLNSSPLNIVFGGIPSNTRYIHPEFEAVAHNEYVDMLLNVGVVDSFIMIWYFFSNYVGYWKKYMITNSNTTLLLVMVKSAWICYVMTLTMFLDFRFMMFFLI